MADEILPELFENAARTAGSLRFVVAARREGSGGSCRVRQIGLLRFAELPQRPFEAKLSSPPKGKVKQTEDPGGGAQASDRQRRFCVPVRRATVRAAVLAECVNCG